MGTRLPDLSLCAHVVDFLEKISQRLLAFDSVRSTRAQCRQCAIDCFIDDMPVGCRARLQGRLRLIPRGFEILDACLRAGKIALVHQGRGIGDNRLLDMIGPIMSV